MVAVPRAVLLALAVLGTIAVAALAFRAVTSSGPNRAPVADVPMARGNEPVAAAPPSPAGVSKPVPLPGTTPTLQKPEFDVVRVTPEGDAVVAGRAEPKATVRLMMGDQTLSDAVADANGQYVLLPKTLPPGEYVLALKASGAGGDVISDQTVAVVVPRRGDQKVMAALTAPDAPTRVLTQPSQPAAGLAPAVAIQTAEAGEEGSFFATGLAAAGRMVRVYLNDTLVATVTAGADGRWSLRVERGMAAGRYAVRADMVDPGGKVAARSEVPFEYPAQATLSAAKVTAPVPSVSVVASVPTPAAGATLVTPGRLANQVAEAPTGVAVVPELRSVLVARGDNLWRISRRVLGRGMRYTQIYEANVAQIRDPNRIFPGQVFVAPTTTD